MLNGYTVEEARDALQYVPADGPRDEWHKMGPAAIAAGLSIDDVDTWSAQAANYAGPRDVLAAFRTIKQDGGTGAGTLFQAAIDNGWCKDGKQRQPRPMPAPRKAAEPPRKPAPGMSPGEVWSRCEQATNAYPYIVGKGAAGVPMGGLRVLPADDRLVIGGVSMAGALFVPAYASDGMWGSSYFGHINR